MTDVVREGIQKSIDECYVDLAMAITQQAAIDYYHAYQYFLRSGKKTKTLIETESFFKSRWGKLLSLGQADRIVGMIQQGIPITDSLGLIEEEVEDTPKVGRHAKYYEFNGERKTLKQWSELVGIPSHTLNRRLLMGWTMEEALTLKKGEVRERFKKKI